MTKVVKHQRIFNIAQDKLASYRQAFDLFDKDKLGLINIDHICHIMDNLGKTLSNDEIQRIIKDIDTCGNGTLDFEDVVCFIQKSEETLEEDEVILKAFKDFDKKKSGYVTSAEFRYILTQTGLKLPETMIDDVFKIIKANEDGNINYREFIDFWKNQ